MRAVNFIAEPWEWPNPVSGSWEAMEQETGVSKRSPLQNSSFLRKKAAYGEMGIYAFAKVPCKSRNLCDNFCKGMTATY